MGLFESIGSFLGTRKRSKDLERQAEGSKQDYWSRLEAMNMEPAQTAEMAPDFKKSSSPVANSYLQSFLMGQNSDAIQGTRAGSEIDKFNAQRAKNETFGSPDEIMAAQRVADSDNSRFKVEPMDRAIRDEGKENYAADSFLEPIEEKTGYKLSSGEAEFLRKNGQARTFKVNGDGSVTLMFGGTFPDYGAALRGLGYKGE